MMKNQKGGVGVVVVIVIAIIALGGISYGVSKSKEAVNSNSGSVATISSDLKTYKNEEYGFDFKYPYDMVVTPGIYLVEISPIEEKIGIQAPPKYNRTTKISISVLNSMVWGESIDSVEEFRFREKQNC